MNFRLCYRPHRPFGRSREEAHALVTDVDENVDEVHYVPIKRGDITVHNERVIHGSGPNLSNGWRRAYIVAYRKKQVPTNLKRTFFSFSVIFFLLMFFLFL